MKEKAQLLELSKKKKKKKKLRTVLIVFIKINTMLRVFSIYYVSILCMLEEMLEEIKAPTT